MLLAFYTEIRIAAGEDSTAKLKSDATFFTIADGIVQHMFIEHLFAGNKFGQIVGEEDDTKVNILEEPYYVDDLVVPDQFTPLIKETLTKVKALASRIDAKAFKDITVFVDPIDGTREFATGKGECVTVLIGYNDPKGQPVAGIVYRPLTVPATWAAGAKSEGCTMGNLDMAKTPNPKGLLVTDGKMSKFIEELIKEGGFNKVNSLASGNRALMVLENKAGNYIRDTGGFAKWDTSGPQAVVEAYGGTMSKLPGFLRDKSLDSYTHLKTDINLDIEMNAVRLSLSNAKDKAAYKALPKAYKDTMITATADMVKEYSCLSGLVCMNKDNMGAANIDAVHKTMLKVMKDHPPTYN
jgi:3'-phosphoadenosine 5'-phosphosulfate (PAPS) 3'-phosphatase